MYFKIFISSFLLILNVTSGQSTCEDYITHAPYFIDCLTPPLCRGGGSRLCLCTENCTWINNNCINNTMTNPIMETRYPRYCRHGNITNNSNCNINGNGSLCLGGCFNEGGNCEITGICNSSYDWTCPEDCSYNKHTNSCIANSFDSVCGLIGNTLMCPIGCTYNNYLKKCISIDQKYACGLEKKLICPLGCRTNVRGDTCMSGPTAISDMNIPMCPHGCRFDANDKICKRIMYGSTAYDVCEPTITLSCQHNEYIIDKNRINNCNYESYDLCMQNGSIQFPKRLYNKYSHIKCKYSNMGGCENKRIVRTCCN